MQQRSHSRSSSARVLGKTGFRTRRVASFKAPPPSRLRRVVRILFNPWTISVSAIILAAGCLLLLYYWFEFSDRIDRRLLSGDVFTASAGIYSAPKNLRVDEKLTLPELIEYLRSAGYVEKTNKADASRSRYSVREDGILIEPGVTGIIDGQRVFPVLDVKFSKGGKTVASIYDAETGKPTEKARLEPRILSTIAAEGDGRRKTITFDDLPSHLVKAITVTEDRAFFEHYGVNFRGIARALWTRYEGEENAALANQGGSSITQQLVKNLLLSKDQTIERKVTEAYMSVILETRLSKKEIFTLYANQIYLGQQAGVAIYGVGEASNVYFGKDVSQLTLAEAAFLAGIVRSPNRYGPYKNPERVAERRNQVLESMLEAGEITPAQYQQARESKLELKPISGRKQMQGMPYFSQYVVDELPKLVGDPEALQHLRVYTSIDPDLQRIAYETVSRRLERLDKLFKKRPPGELNAALVAIRPKTGEIVAMVGGRDYLDNQFNRATSAMRQPGSVFKPFVYAAAINSAYEPSSRVFTTATIFKDERKVFTYGRETYAPGNFGDFFSNKEITLRDALVKSKNNVTVDLAMQVNVGRVMNLAHRAGLPKVERAYPSMALGTAEATPLQVATAYTAFANLGDRVLPMPITQLTAGDGSTRLAPVPDRKAVLRSDVAYIMNDIMKDVINRGTAAQAQSWGFKNADGRAFAGKTGTSRDGWFVGYTPELVCVVYVGFDNNDDLRMTGGESAMPIWADFMREALNLHPEWNGDWPMPAGIRKAEIDIRNGSLVRELDGAEVLNTAVTPTPTPKVPDPAIDAHGWAIDETPVRPEIFVTNVPDEFRRVEIFISGTIPNRYLLRDEDIAARAERDKDADNDPSRPIAGTWQEQVEGLPAEAPANTKPQPDNSASKPVAGLRLTICALTGMRASINCPTRESRTFRDGTEPKEFCTFHR
jgi:penicillin-binding protein 1B